MKTIKAPKDPRNKTVVISSILLLIALPLVILGATQDNLDTRNQAYQEYTVSEENPCVVSFPNVNPYTLEVGKSFTIVVDAEVKNGAVKDLNIVDSTGAQIYSKTFEETPKAISSNFIFTPNKSGEIDLNGLLTTTLGESVACVISSPYDILGANAINSNSAPIFTTQPNLQAQIIQTGDTFEYLLTAEDVDGDRINFSTSFTPTSDWLRETVIEDGSNGKLTIKFRGSTSKPASYLANIFIHDGYSTHLRSQSWVISVSQDENDKPVITILQPLQSLRLNHGDTFTTKWVAQDLNLISKYQIFLSSNPANEDTWVKVNDNLPPKTTEYLVNTSIVDPGTYRLIAKAIDNQNPEAFGLALSNEIVVSTTESTQNNDIPDDIVILAEPQVTNMSPNSTDEVSNPRVTIKATIIAGQQATIIDEDIAFYLDTVKKTESVKINKITDTSYTIIYQPEEDLEAGLHKAEIYFKDSNGKEVTKNWTFTIKNNTSSTDSNIINIFGLEFSQRTAIIVGVGIIILLVAIIAPIIIFSIWKEDESKAEYTSSTNPKLPPTIPTDTTTYVPLNKDTGLRTKVEENTPEETSKDSWDKYNAAKPEGTMEIKEDYLVPQAEKPKKKVSPKPVIVEEKKEILEPTLPTPVKVEPKPTTPKPIVEENTIPEPTIPEPVIPAPTKTNNEEEAIQQLYQQIQEAKKDGTDS